ncbi:hypothetical protein D3C76_1611280 [compost metagenome]
MVFLGHVMNGQAFLVVICFDILFGALNDPVVLRGQFFSGWILSMVGPVEIAVIKDVIVSLFPAPKDSFITLAAQYA